MAAVNGTASPNGTPSPSLNSAPFSYAQAAKGKSPAPQSSQDTKSSQPDSNSSTTPVAEPLANWADDSQTMVDNHDSSHVVNGEPRKSSRSSVEDVKSAEASHGGSTLADSRSSSMPKDEVRSPSVPAPTELPWRRRPQEAESVNGSNSDVASQKGDRKEKTKEKTSFVEAPTPTVNFWAQRVQDAKTKVGTVAQAPPSKPVVNGADNTPDIPPVAPVQSNTDPRGRTDRSEPALPREQKSAGAEERSGRAKRTRFSSMGDAQSWPTPETAKDDERRKSQPKTETAQQSSDAPARKPHGKQQYEKLDFVPTAKFETPVPPIGSRRGGRGGFRGGRGDAGGRGGYGPSNGRSLPPPATPDDSVSTKADQTTSRPAGPPSKNKKTVDDSSRPAVEGSRVQKSGEVAASTPLVNGTAPPEAGRTSPKPTQIQADQPDAGARRKSSKAAESDAPHFKPSENGSGGYADRKRGNSVNGNGNGNGPKPGWRGEHPGKNGDRSDGMPPFARGEGRPERGRGGKRGGAYGGHGSLSFQPPPNSSMAQPYWPSNGNANGSFQHGYPAPFAQMRNHRLSTPRSGSFPTDMPFPSPMPNMSPMPSPGFSGYYGFGGMGQMPQPVPQPSFDPYSSQFSKINGIAHQLNYYFSFENLIKDTFLRRHMTTSGFVPLAFIANFQRMKYLSQDFNLIKHVAETSPDFLVRNDVEGNTHIRKRDDWQQFVLPKDERLVEAQNDGPIFLEEPNGQYYENDGHRQAAEAMFHPTQPPVFFPQNFSPVPTGSPLLEPMNGHPRSPPDRWSGPAAEPQFTYPQQPPPTSFLTEKARDAKAPEDEADAFPDDKIHHLLVVSGPQSGQQASSSRKPSSSSAEGGLLKPEEKIEEETGGNHKREHSARLADIKRTLTSPPPSHKSQASTSSSADAALFVIKEKGDEPKELPPNSNSEHYGQICANALQQRQTGPPGDSYDMRVLYNFWGHFLLRNFNTRMYTDFKELAHQDKTLSSEYGLQTLMRFYQESLLSSSREVRKQVARDFVNLVAEEDKNGPRPAFKLLYSTFRNGALPLKNRSIVQKLVQPHQPELWKDLDR